jgi:hypothetical protein
MGSALATIVAASAAPYGYTLSVWGSGALALSMDGVPRQGEVVAFVLGAVLAYGLLALATRSRIAAGNLLHDDGRRVTAGALNWLAVGAALGVADLAARIPGWTAWPAASFSATGLYLLLVSAQLALVTRRAGPG